MNVWQPNSPLGGLPYIKHASSKRESSYDRTGGNILSILMYGCSGKETVVEEGKIEEKSLTVLVEGGSPAFTVAKETAEEFKEKTGYEVKIESVPYTGVYDKLKAEVASQAGAFDVATNEKLILDIKDYLNTNYREPIVLEDLGKHFYKNPSYLCSLFSKSVGKTIFEYITSTRINNAKKLLRTSNCKVADVAIQVGYENQKYFYQVFKKNVGITPSQYRSKHLVK